MVERVGPDRRGQAVDDLVIDLAAQRHRLVALLVAQMATNRRARLAGDREIEPVGLRRLRLGAQDLHLIAILDRGAQRHDAAVDLRAHRLIAEIGVHGISEIDRRRALGQLDQFAGGREGEDAILIHRHACMLEQLLGARCGIEDFDQVANPADLRVRTHSILLVRPMRGQAIFGLLVHLVGADLHFDAGIVGVHHGGVQRSIAVALGRRDIVLEPARHHRPAAVDHAQGAVAFLLGIDDRAKRHDVGKLLEADVPFGHLAPDRIGMLLAPRNLRFDAAARQEELQPRSDLGDPVAAARLQRLQPLGDRFIRLGLELAKRQRLHLDHEFVHADPLRERGVDIHRLLGDAAALLGLRDVVKRAHVVQAIGELDQQHANIVGHRQQELAQVFRGALILGLRLDRR